MHYALSKVNKEWYAQLTVFQLFLNSNSKFSCTVHLFLPNHVHGHHFILRTVSRLLTVLGTSFTVVGIPWIFRAL